MSTPMRVNGWQTRDGKIFPEWEKVRAEAHELELDFTAWCDREFGPVLGNNEVAKAILSNWTVARREPDAAVG